MAICPIFLCSMETHVKAFSKKPSLTQKDAKAAVDFECDESTLRAWLKFAKNKGEVNCFLSLILAGATRFFAWPEANLAAAGKFKTLRLRFVMASVTM